MSLPPVSPRVLRFIAERIDTVAELETLLILCDDELRPWSEQEIAARLYTQPADALRVLGSLARHELVTHDGKPPRFRFKPGTQR